jgi:hypothetical protein
MDGSVARLRCCRGLAERVWGMHTDRAGFRHFADDLDA